VDSPDVPWEISHEETTPDAPAAPNAQLTTDMHPQSDQAPKASPRGVRHHYNRRKKVPKGRTLLAHWGLHMVAIQNTSDTVQDRWRAAQPRPVGKLIDLFTQDLLRLALCLVNEESASADSRHTREAMWADPEPWLAVLLQELQDKTYRPSPIRRDEIPKGDGTFRPLGLPALRDKVVQMALLLILDPILDPQFVNNSVGFRLMRKPQEAIHRVRKALESFPTAWVIDLDLKDYFGTIPWAPLMEMLKRYVSDPDILHLIQQILMTPVKLASGKLEYPTQGTPQGGVLSPLFGNLYLHHILDMWLTSTIQKQIHGCLEFARFADDIVIIVTQADEAQSIHRMVMERMEAFGLACNAQKTKLVNMTRPSKAVGPQEQTFPFLGFQFSWQPDQARGWRLANVISDTSTRKSMMRLQQWLDHHSLEGMTEAFCEYPALALGRRMAGFYGYYLHPHPDDAWAIQKHNTQALELILNTWGPEGLSREDEADVRYIMDPDNRTKVFKRYRHLPAVQESQPRRAEAFKFVTPES
jgi:group II intron reverse transcriptase/maturase